MVPYTLATFQPFSFTMSAWFQGIFALEIPLTSRWPLDWHTSYACCISLYLCPHLFPIRPHYLFSGPLCIGLFGVAYPPSGMPYLIRKMVCLTQFLPLLFSSLFTLLPWSFHLASSFPWSFLMSLLLPNGFSSSIAPFLFLGPQSSRVWPYLKSNLLFCSSSKRGFSREIAYGTSTSFSLSSSSTLSTATLLRQWLTSFSLSLFLERLVLFVSSWGFEFIPLSSPTPLFLA